MTHKFTFLTSISLLSASQALALFIGLFGCLVGTSNLTWPELLISLSLPRKFPHLLQCLLSQERAHHSLSCLISKLRNHPWFLLSSHPQMNPATSPIGSTFIALFSIWDLKNSYFIFFNFAISGSVATVIVKQTLAVSMKNLLQGILRWNACKPLSNVKHPYHVIQIKIRWWWEEENLDVFLSRCHIQVAVLVNNNIIFTGVNIIFTGQFWNNHQFTGWITNEREFMLFWLLG